MSPVAPLQEELLCRCLRVSQDQVEEAVSVSGCQTLCEVRRQTGAGSGCTACHRRICEMLASRTLQSSDAPIS